jgi:hypothetical protein
MKQQYEDAQVAHVSLTTIVTPDASDKTREKAMRAFSDRINAREAEAHVRQRLLAQDEEIERLRGDWRRASRRAKKTRLVDSVACLVLGALGMLLVTRWF